MDESTCRVCLSTGARQNIFRCSGLAHTNPLELELELELELVPADMILTLAAVTAYENDGLPTCICENCTSNLKAAYSFKRQCEMSHSFLLENFKKEQIIKPIKEESNSYKDIYVSPNTQIKTEFIDTDSNPLNSHEYIDSLESIDSSNALKKSKLKHFKKHKKKLKKIAKTRDKSKNDKTKEILGVDVNQLKNGEGKFACNQCPRTFQCRRGFIRHLERHMGIKSFFCEICQKYYAREWVHMQTHIRPRVKEFLCEHCNKMFESKSALNYHIKIHTDEKPHICDDCGKAFKRLDRLEIHKKIHSGIKEYICQFCSKDFYMQKNLVIHIKYKHTEERSFQCDKCEKRFVTRQCLTIHERRHLGIKNFHCEFCEKSFVSKSGLISHVTMHTKEKPHACRVCSAKFGRSDHRNRHELKAHSIDFRHKFESLHCK